MYAAGTLLAVIVLVVGAAILNNYDQMKSMQDTLNYLSQNMEEVQSNFTEDRVADSDETHRPRYRRTDADAVDAQDTRSLQEMRIRQM